MLLYCVNIVGFGMRVQYTGFISSEPNITITMIIVRAWDLNKPIQILNLGVKPILFFFWLGIFKKRPLQLQN